MAIREASPLGHRSTLPAGGRVPWVCQGLLVERLVRPFMVELLAKDVKRPLLRREAARRRAGRLRLQRTMHPLMRTVLRRPTARSARGGPLDSGAMLAPTSDLQKPVGTT